MGEDQRGGSCVRITWEDRCHTEGPRGRHTGEDLWAEGGAGSLGGASSQGQEGRTGGIPTGTQYNTQHHTRVAFLAGYIMQHRVSPDGGLQHGETSRTCCLPCRGFAEILAGGVAACREVPGAEVGPHWAL